jgi:hypothetical protein
MSGGRRLKPTGGPHTSPKSQHEGDTSPKRQREGHSSPKRQRKDTHLGATTTERRVIVGQELNELGQAVGELGPVTKV